MPRRRPLPRGPRHALAAACLLMPLLVACSGRAPVATATSAPAGSPAASGVLQGHLYAVGGPADAAREALPGTLVVTGAEGAQVAAAGADGAFSLTLAPGTYRLVGHSPDHNSGRTACLADGSVTVTGGATVVRDVICSRK